MASNGLTFTELEQYGEPTLDEIFAEPIVQLIMKRDGVDAADMRGTIARMLKLYTPATPVQ
jgi:hypothetical protein